MKLIGELKEKVEAAKSNEEKKVVIAQAGMLLTDDELRDVSGGANSLTDIESDSMSRKVLKTERVLIGTSSDGFGSAE